MLNTCCLKFMVPIGHCTLHDAPMVTGTGPFGPFCFENGGLDVDCVEDPTPSRFRVLGHRWHEEALEDAAGC